MNAARVLLLCLSVLFSYSTQAHPASQSQIAISRDYQQVKLLLTLPLDQLAIALPQAGQWQYQASPDFHGLAEYLDQHMSLSQAGERLTTVIREIAIARSQEVKDEFEVKVAVSATLTSSDNRELLLTYDAIQHKVINHRTVVTLVNDIYRGTMFDGPVLLGVLRYKHTHIAITDSSSEISVMADIFSHGMAHIVTGTDHLAFLLCLLLVTGMSAKGRKWQQQRANVTDCVKLVTAFTAGHTVTLVANLLLPNPVISDWVEVAVAITVLLSAIHVITPLFTGKPYWMAIGFGLVHGMAFSSALNVAGLSAVTTTLAALNFNLGIELVQVGLICLLVPCINIWRQTVLYPAARVILAVTVAVLAVIWIIQRMTPFLYGLDTTLRFSVLTNLMGITIIVTALLYVCTPRPVQKNLKRLMS